MLHEEKYGKPALETSIARCTGSRESRGHKVILKLKVCSSVELIGSLPLI
jgi:hypothetical protein